MQRERLNGLMAVTLAVALILVCLPASAQLRIVGSISGTVQDSTGAAVPGAKVVNELPTGGRDVSLGVARVVAGINNASSGSRVNNVAGGAINVTVDGINDASNGFKSGGTVWYNTVPVRLGALEEVTVETGG